MSFVTVLRRSSLAGGLALACSFDSAGAGAGVSTGAEASGGTDEPNPGTSTSASQGTGSASGTVTGSGPTTGDSMDPQGTSSASSATDSSATDSSGSGDGSTTGSDTESETDCTLLLAEALTSLDGADDGREWVVLYNPCEGPVELGPLSLAWGGTNYAGAVDLVGTVAAGECFVVGGPDANAANFDPPLAQTVNFEPNLSRNPGAIGLFELAPGEVDVGDTPLDVVVYGDANTGGFLDPSGAMPGPVLPANLDLQSMRRTSLASTWEFADPPTPGACPSL